jgi:hypothetical protein
MFVLCVVSTEKKAKCRKIQEKKTITAEIQSTTQHKKKIAVEERFSAFIQSGPGAHSASCTMGTESFPGVKRPELGVNQSPLTSTEVKEIVELYSYLYSPSAVSWPVLAGNFTFLFPHLHLFFLYYFVFSRITFHFCLSFFIYILAPLIPLPLFLFLFIICIEDPG